MTETKAKPVKVPDRDSCLRMLRESGCDEDVISHCVAVSQLAVRIAKRCSADVSLVEAGALLHDIGRARTHGMAHAVEGARIISELRLPSQIARIVERHIGGGLSKAEAKMLDLPQKDYSPRTLEEKIVAHADNLISSTDRTTVSEAISQMVRKGMHGPAAKVLQLHKDLSGACGCDVDDIL